MHWRMFPPTSIPTQIATAPRAGHPLFPAICRQDEMSRLSIGKHVLEIQGQRIDLIVVTGYGESNELVAEVDSPRLIVENCQAQSRAAPRFPDRAPRMPRALFKR
jgi:hypothetical protein